MTKKKAVAATVVALVFAGVMPLTASADWLHRAQVARIKRMGSANTRLLEIEVKDTSVCGGLFNVAEDRIGFAEIFSLALSAFLSGKQLSLGYNRPGPGEPEAPCWVYGAAIE